MKRAKEEELIVEYNPEARAALLEVVENQISGTEAPEVRLEHQRLLREGYTNRDVRETIAYVLGCHLVKAMRTKIPFDYADYLADLRRLPKCDMDRHFTE